MVKDHSQFLVRLSFFIGMICLLHCGGGLPKHVATYPLDVTAAMRTQFHLAETEYHQHNYDRAYPLYQNYIDQYEHNLLTDEAYYKQGKLYFLRRDFINAVSRFRILAKLSPDAVYRNKAFFMSGYSYHEHGDFTAALKDFDKVNAESFSPKLRLQYYSLVLKSAQSVEGFQERADESKLQMYDLYQTFPENLQALQAADVLSYQQVKTLIDAWLNSPLDVKNIPSWMKKYPDGVGKGVVDFKLAKTYFEAGDQKQARRLLSAFVLQHSKSPYYDKAQALLKEWGGPEDVEIKEDVKFTIGVLASLSGKNAAYGEAVLKGVRCAARDGVCGNTSQIKVIIKDSGYTPEGVRAAYNELKDAGVSAIVGILSGHLIEEAAHVASEEKIPLFLISQQENLMKQSDYIFQLGISTKQQVHEMVKHARSQGLKRFAIFYPNIRYGDAMVGLFSAEVKAQEGQVIAKSAYNRLSHDPFAEARRFKVNLQLSGTGAYDAIFLPDTYRAVNVMITALEFNEIKDIPLIGTNTWNNSKLSNTIHQSFPGSFFIDIYDPDAKSLENKDFRGKFFTSFGEYPESLHALGYDAAQMVAGVVVRHGPRSVFKGLSLQQSFSGVTGLKGFEVGSGPIVTPQVVEVSE